MRSLSSFLAAAWLAWSAVNAGAFSSGLVPVASGGPDLGAHRGLNAEAGLAYFGYRFYNPGLGRWTSRDPLGETADSARTLYRFIGNNLPNSVDPLGIITIMIPGAGPDSERSANADLRAFAGDIGGQYVSRHWFWSTRAAIKEASAKGDPVNIIGFSRGAVSAVNLAGDLQSAGITVDLLVTLDPVAILGIHDSIDVPSNVKRAVNFYQTEGGSMFRGEFRGTPLTESKDCGDKVDNRKLTGITHPFIPGDADVQKAMRVLLGLGE